MNIETIYEEISAFINANLKSWKQEARCFYEEKEENDEEYYLQITFGTDGEKWNYQTGDNSYTGGAYSFPYWAVTYIAQDTDAKDLMEEIKSQWDDLIDPSLHSESRGMIG